MNAGALEPQARRLASPAQAMLASYFGYDTTTPTPIKLVQQPANQLEPLLEGAFCSTHHHHIAFSDPGSVYKFFAKGMPTVATFMVTMHPPPWRTAIRKSSRGHVNAEKLAQAVEG